MFTVYCDDFLINCADRDGAIDVLNSMNIDGMEATRDAIDFYDTEFFSDIHGYVTIKHNDIESSMSAL